MLTTKWNKADIISALETGANDYLSKPFDAGELLARVKVGRRMLEMQDALVIKNAELLQALEQVRTLSGIVPICMHCKNIRDDKGYWEKVEAYVSSHTDARFSHGICPECLKKHYPEILRDGLQKRSP
jgi:response regulator RpfG family c-di-GMP phosphodiesterase